MRINARSDIHSGQARLPSVGLTGLAFLLWSLAFNLMFPLLPLYAAHLGARGVQVGFVAGVAAAGAALLAFPLAALADRRGQRLALLAGWGASAAGWLFMAGADTWRQLLPGAFLITGPIAALPALNALILDEVPRQHSSRALSLVYGAAPVGLLLGSPLGGHLADEFGLATVVRIAGCGCLAATLCLLLLRHRSRARDAAAAAPVAAAAPAAGAGVEATARFVLIGLGVIITAAFTVINMPTNFIVPFLHDVGGQSLRAAGLFTSYLALAQIFWSLVFAVWPRSRGHVRLGPFQLQLAPLIGIAVCLAANGAFGLLMPSDWRFAWYIALFLRGSQYSLQALGSAVLGDVVSPGAARTTRMTTLSLGVGVGAVLAPIMAGWLYDDDPAAPFAVSGVTAAVAAAVLAVGLWYLARWQRRSPSGPAF